MKIFTICPLLLLAVFSITPDSLADTFGSGGNRFAIEFVTIGNPDNAAEINKTCLDADCSTTVDQNPAGAVDYVYRIGKHEISREMVNRASAVGGLGITLDPMEFVSGGPRTDMAATGVSWNEAARFANWLNTSQGFSPAYKFSAQPGDVDYHVNTNIELWVAGDAGFDAANPIRNRRARYFLPTRDEWYKAAYYDPTIGGYWDFPSGSDTEPAGVANGTDPNTAVYLQTHTQGPADIMHAGGLSPYGAMGLGGNVYEWVETVVREFRGESIFGLRGGRWSHGNATNLHSAAQWTDGNPLQEGLANGFRVASVPEPSSLLLAALGTTAIWCWRRRSN